jgi:nitroreductase
MEFTDVVLDRHAVRKYLPTPVPRELIQELIGLASHAPSAMNRQPWAFVIIDDQDRIAEYAALAKQHFLAHEEVPNSVRAELEHPGYDIFHHAPLLVLVVAKSDGSQASEDCCLAAQTLMLAARNAGLGSCWVGFSRSWLNLPETRAMLKLPARYRVVAPIVIGYPVESPPPHGRAPPEVHWLS